VARQVKRGVAAANEPVAVPDRELEQAVQPPPAAPWTGEAEGIPGYARLVSEVKETQADARRREQAEAELARRREAAERDAVTEPGVDVPDLRQIGIELAIGAMRLARTVATAPLRIGLAFLRDG
jgi:hypothetical protein